RNPGFAAEGAGLKTFDYVVANPMWNQDNYDEAFYENDPWKRFGYGTPPRSSADWGWVEHVLASLNEGGRAAIVLGTGEVSHGWEGREKLSRVVTVGEARAADYNLSPSQFVEVGERARHRPLGEILADLELARKERERADEELGRVLTALRLDGRSNS